MIECSKQNVKKKEYNGILNQFREYKSRELPFSDVRGEGRFSRLPPDQQIPDSDDPWRSAPEIWFQRFPRVTARLVKDGLVA